MPDHNGMATQYLACFLIVLSLAAIGAADHFNMRDLSNAGLTVLGIGGGLLTGKFMTQSTQSGDINTAPPSTSPVPPVKLGV